MTLVNKIFKQALNTFKNNDTFPYNLDKLLALTNSVTAKDLGISAHFDKITHDDDSIYIPAPVAHINIHEGQHFTFGIFIIRKGKSLPLHDHPGMSGICKVLWGKVKIKSYQLPSSHGDNVTSQSAFLVDALPEVTADSSSECIVLNQRYGNYHSISSLDGDAAIFDILAPPYSESRDCNYYRELQHSTKKEETSSASVRQCWLLKIPQPRDFYCDSLPYCGPKVDT